MILQENEMPLLAHRKDDFLEEEKAKRPISASGRAATCQKGSLYYSEEKTYLALSFAFLSN